MSLVSLEFKFPKLDAKLKSHWRELHIFLAAQMQTNRGLLFDNEGAYSGHKKWKELQFRRGQILSDRGTLRKSISPVGAKGIAGAQGISRISGDEVTIGTKLIYADLMDKGGKVEAKNAKALKIPIPSGKGINPEFAKKIKAGKIGGVIRQGRKRFMFRKSVVIPARPFSDITQQDKAEWEDAMTNEIERILKGV